MALNGAALEIGTACRHGEPIVRLIHTLDGVCQTAKIMMASRRGSSCRAGGRKCMYVRAVFERSVVCLHTFLLWPRICSTGSVTWIASHVGCIIMATRGALNERSP